MQRYRAFLALDTEDWSILSSIWQALLALHRTLLDEVLGKYKKRGNRSRNAARPDWIWQGAVHVRLFGRRGDGDDIIDAHLRRSWRSLKQENMAPQGQDDWRV